MRRGDESFGAALLTSCPTTKLGHYRVFQFANARPGDYLGHMTESQKRLKRIMKDALRIQDRFAAEPVLARTGKGFLKSEGVADAATDQSRLEEICRPLSELHVALRQTLARPFRLEFCH